MSIGFLLFSVKSNLLLLSQLATSMDLERINSEIIESVKFAFIAKDILNKPKVDTKSNLLDITQIQDARLWEPPLYDSGNELLEDILKSKNYKHSKHLVYLAQKHDGKILKVADLVNDDPKTRDKVVAYLRTVRTVDDLDLIIALGMAKEGFDWPQIKVFKVTQGRDPNLNVATDFVAKRKPCKDFEKYKALFKSV